MKAVDLNCMECGTVMAKLNVPAASSTSGEKQSTNGLLCLPCAEKIHLMKKK